MASTLFFLFIFMRDNVSALLSGSSPLCSPLVLGKGNECGNLPMLLHPPKVGRKSSSSISNFTLQNCHIERRLLTFYTLAVPNSPPSLGDHQYLLYIRSIKGGSCISPSNLGPPQLPIFDAAALCVTPMTPHSYNAGDSSQPPHSSCALPVTPANPHDHLVCAAMTLASPRPLRRHN